MKSTGSPGIGLIGFGMIGKVHAYAWRSLPFFFPELPRGRITHVVTSRRETAEQARSLVHADHASTDYREVTENPGIDIVHICTPNHLHTPAILSAMEHQKAIYCDKPLAVSPEETDAIEAALVRYRSTSQMTFQTRFVGAVRRAKELCDDGRIGRILSFRFQYLHGGSVSPETPMKWRFSAGSGGGVIADLASHVLDLIEFLMGPIDSLSAASTIVWPTRPDSFHRPITVDTEDHLCALVRLGNGALGTLEATKVATGTEDDLRFEIHGTHGAVRFSLMEPHFVEFFDQTR
ncbi:MAG: Gfo/Idh/MocA family oxidoreductase, partial [Planctomycetia bacterium]|nr:Gfo/Idh/MocA family oxidoreductase [Planctomycetia bacterium]